MVHLMIHLVQGQRHPHDMHPLIHIMTLMIHLMLHLSTHLMTHLMMRLMIYLDASHGTPHDASHAGPAAPWVSAVTCLAWSWSL